MPENAEKWVMKYFSALSGPTDLLYLSIYIIATFHTDSCLKVNTTYAFENISDDIYMDRYCFLNVVVMGNYFRLNICK